MNKSKLIRAANMDDIGEIYELLCQVQLIDDPKKMNQQGFLITDFSKHPEIKTEIAKWIKHHSFYVYEKDVILGLLLSYTEQQWKEERPNMVDEGGNSIIWDPLVLRSFGFSNISDLDAFAVLDKIVVSPSARRYGIGKTLMEHYKAHLKKQGIGFILSEVVDAVYSGTKLISIKNEPSIKFHLSIGAVKIGVTKIYNFPNSILGENGRFRCVIYLIPLEESTF